eukprot:12926240-Prorocentrum_lima.AAC.1
MDISAAFLRGMTLEEIAKETGGTSRSVPAADVWISESLPGMVNYNNTRFILNRLKAMWGLKDAPRPFVM